MMQNCDNIISDLVKRSLKRKSENFTLSGFIRLPNCVIYVTVDVFLFNKLCLGIYDYNDITRDNFDDLLEMDISAVHGGAPLEIEYDLTEEMIKKDIMEMFFDGHYNYKNLKYHKYTKHSHDFVYPLNYAYYDYYTGELKEDFDNYYFSIDFY